MNTELQNMTICELNTALSAAYRTHTANGIVNDYDLAEKIIAELRSRCPK